VDPVQPQPVIRDWQDRWVRTNVENE